MSWVHLVLIGATLNVAINVGYKVIGNKETFIMMMGFVYLICATSMLGYAFASKSFRLSDLGEGWVPYTIIMMGLLTPVCVWFFGNALAKGPISLVDPLWACVYALVSVGVGMLLLREAPSMTALAGVGLYLTGAVLMARG